MQEIKNGKHLNVSFVKMVFMTEETREYEKHLNVNIWNFRIRRDWELILWLIQTHAHKNGKITRSFEYS